MPRMCLVTTIFLVLTAVCPLGCSKEPEIEGKKVYEWIALFRHQDWAVQSEAQDTLARLGKPAIPYLKRNVAAKDPALRRGAVIALGKMGELAVDTIPDMLRQMKVEEVDVIRAEILKALALIDPKGKGVKAEFEKRLRDRSAEVRDAARAGLAALAPPEPKPEKGDEEKTDDSSGEFVLRAEVADQIEKSGVSFGMIAEVVREDRRAAIVWPAIKEGKVIDDDIVAFVFERKGKKWHAVSENLLMSGSGAANKLAEALGGADKQRVIRKCGVDKKDLETYLNGRAKSFSEALDAGDAARAIKAFEEMTQAYSFRLVAFDDMLPELLIKKSLVDSPWNIEPAADGKSARVTSRAGDKVRQGTLRLGGCGGKTVISGFKPGPEAQAEVPKLTGEKADEKGKKGGKENGEEAKKGKKENKEKKKEKEKPAKKEAE